MREFGQSSEGGMRRFGQKGQKHIARVVTDHRRFVGDLRRVVSRMHAQNMPLRLQRTAELCRTHGGRSGDDHRLNGRIGQYLFEIADPTRLAAPAA